MHPICGNYGSYTSAPSINHRAQIRPQMWVGLIGVARATNMHDSMETPIDSTLFDFTLGRRKQTSPRPRQDE